MKASKWIQSPVFDLIWIIAPLFIPVLCVLLYSDYFNAMSTHINSVYWVVLILCIDVSHVYSTVFRTYFNADMFQKRSALLVWTPFIVFLIAVLLYTLSDLLFWRCLAYLAVFHFIRQQYGFMRIYSRGESSPLWIQQFHKSAIYLFTGIPILIWHLTGPKNFNWFIDADFIYFEHYFLAIVLKYVFIGLMLAYFVSEIFLFQRLKIINGPRLLLMTGTAFSWYIGIVMYNGDLIFTFLNVVAHGIPYMALVWIMERNKAKQSSVNSFYKIIFSNYGVLIFFGIILLFGFVEEGLWDTLVWHEQRPIFSWLHSFYVSLSDKYLAIVIPLLSLPQIVHYILDGFIWRKQDE